MAGDTIATAKRAAELLDELHGVLDSLSMDLDTNVSVEQVDEFLAGNEDPEKWTEAGFQRWCNQLVGEEDDLLDDDEGDDDEDYDDWEDGEDTDIPY